MSWHYVANGNERDGRLPSFLLNLKKLKEAIKALQNRAEVENKRLTHVWVSMFESSYEHDYVLAVGDEQEIYQKKQKRESIDKIGWKERRAAQKAQEAAPPQDEDVPF